MLNAKGIKVRAEFQQGRIDTNADEEDVFIVR
jgi:hypothetical protein